MTDQGVILVTPNPTSVSQPWQRGSQRTRSDSSPVALLTVMRDGPVDGARGGGPCAGKSRPHIPKNTSSGISGGYLVAATKQETEGIQARGRIWWFIPRMMSMGVGVAE